MENEQSKRLVVVGNSAFAQIAYEYFTHDSPYEVVAFSVERSFLKETSIFGLPVVPFEELERDYAPSEHSVYVAAVYTQFNRLRTRLMQAAKGKGYHLASYISSNAFVWKNVQLGEHCFIFENNVVQPFVHIGNNVVLWSGNHIGHHSTIRDNCFVSSHVVVSGFVDVGENCFLGVNATIANNVTIGADCLIGAGATILKDAPGGLLYGAKMTESRTISPYKYFGIEPPNQTTSNVLVLFRKFDNNGILGNLFFQYASGYKKNVLPQGQLEPPNVYTISISPYMPADRESWEEFVLGSKNGTFLFCRNYMEYHADRFADASLVLRDKHGTLIALLPATRTGNVLNSHGGLTYGGLVTNARMTTPVMVDLWDELIAFLKKEGIARLLYKTIPSIYHHMPAEEDKYALFLHSASLVRRDVLSVFDTRSRVPYQERRKRAIKRAQHQGLVVRESADLPAFWDILEATLADTHKTRPVHSLDEMTLLQSRFPNNIRLFAAYQQERMLAGILSYETSTVAHAQYISSNIEGKEAGALDLTIDYLISQAYTEMRYFDLGISNEQEGRILNRGLIEQKEGFGARAIVHDFYELTLLFNDNMLPLCFQRYEQRQLRKALYGSLRTLFYL